MQYSYITESILKHQCSELGFTLLIVKKLFSQVPELIDIGNVILNNLYKLGSTDCEYVLILQ